MAKRVGPWTGKCFGALARNNAFAFFAFFAQDIHIELLYSYLDVSPASSASFCCISDSRCAEEHDEC